MPGYGLEIDQDHTGIDEDRSSSIDGEGYIPFLLGDLRLDVNQGWMGFISGLGIDLPGGGNRLGEGDYIAKRYGGWMEEKGWNPGDRDSSPPDRGYQE